MKQYIRHHIGILGLSILFTLAEAGVNIILAFAMGNLSNAAVSKDIAYLFRQGGVAVVCLLLILGLQLLAVYTRKLFARKCVTELKRDVYRKLLDCEPKEFHQMGESYFMNLLQVDVDTVYKDYFSVLGTIVGYAVEILCSAAALMFVSVRIFVIFMLVSSLPPLVLHLLKKHMAKVRTDYSQSAEHYVSVMKEFIQGLDTIIFFQKGRIFFEKMEHEDKKLERARMENDVTHIGGTAVSKSVGMIAHIVCMIAATYFIVTDHLEIGVLITSTQLLNFIFSPFHVMNSQIASLRSTKTIRQKFERVLELAHDTATEDCRGGDIVFENVELSYGERVLFEDFSYTFAQGKKYAVIGRSGIGKTSIAKALTRFLTPSCGSIRIGTQEIAAIRRESLLKYILYVPQSVFLFSGSVPENITLFSGEEKAACEIGSHVGLSHELLAKTEVGDMGASVSGGEKQRIAIARALLKNPEVYIFDEPTSGLDPILAARIEKYIMDIQGKTVIVITHNWDKENLERFDGVIEL